MKNIKKLSDVFATREEIEKRVDEIFEFLALVHPTATEGVFHNPIEIRFLERSEKGTKGLHSCNLFGLNEKSKEQLIKKIETYVKKSVCMYYSPYKYDWYYKTDLKKTKRNGEKYTHYGNPMKIHSESALGTQELPMDFDHISYEGFIIHADYLRSLGLEMCVVFTGNGFQGHVLLDKYYEQKGLLRQFTDRLLQLGLPVDPSLVDDARVTRLISTVNFKKFDKQQNPTGEAVAMETKLVAKTEKRYSLEEVFAILDKEIAKKRVRYETIEDEDEQQTMVDEFLDAFAPEWKEEKVDTAKPESKKTTKPKAKKEGAKKEAKLKTKKETEHEVKTEEFFAEAYKHLDFKTLQSLLKRILMGVDEGVRNDALLFLLPFLRNELRLSMEKVKETLIVWGAECNPPYSADFITSEVERLWQYDNQATFGKYTKSLEDLYGELNIRHEVVSDREILIENKLLRKIPKLEGAALKVYLTMKLLEKEENRRELTKEEIQDRAEISEKTLERAMRILISLKLINKKKSVKKQEGEKVMLSINTLGSDVYGYTRIETATVELMIIKNLSKFEFAFYVYMCAKTWSSTESVFTMSRENIAEAIGSSSETTISKITDNLHKKRFIRKETIKKGKHMICRYTLLK